MIEVDRLTKEYSGTLAVDRISFRAEPGQIVGFLGPNGAGKTTTIRILACYLAASEGTARVAGHDVATESLAVRRNLGYLPETNPLYPDMRVEEFLHFRARLKGVGSRNDRRRVVDRICELCWIDKVRTRIVGQLSKGFRQRVGLAEALIADPPVVILDEPTVGLDPHQVRQVRRIIRELGERKTVLFSTHILSEVEELCDRIIIISKGRIVADGTRDEIVAKLGARRAWRALVDGPRDEVAAALSKIRGVVQADLRSWKGTRVDVHLWTEGSPDGFEAEVRTLAASKSWQVSEFGSEVPDLEDLFVHLTKSEATAS